MRKPTFCICENKDADQLRGNREADQRLCFRYTDTTIPLLSKSEISSLYPSSMPGMCQTWWETPTTGFLTTRLLCVCYNLPKLGALFKVRLCITLAPKKDHFRRKSWALFLNVLPFCLLGCKIITIIAILIVIIRKLVCVFHDK